MKEYTSPTIRIGRNVFQRIRYGDEHDIAERNRKSCRSCGVIEGDVHIFGCEVESCPRCQRQAISCDCPCGNRSIKKARQRT